jgi:galactokinase
MRDYVATGLRTSDLGGFAFFVPGRIELLGKHTDYAGGRSLLCALDRGFGVVAMPRPGSLVTVMDSAGGKRLEFPLDPDIAVPRGDWGTYVATVVRRVARNFPEARAGGVIGFTSDLPAASGMSSSTALVIATYLGLEAINELRTLPRYQENIRTPEDLAAYLASIEMGGDFGTLAGDEGVGTLGGSEDHTAILCCKEGFVSRYSFAPTRNEGTIPFPAGQSLAVAFCGHAAPKTGSAQESYNAASLATRRILSLWNQESRRTDPTLGAAVTSDPDAPDRIRRLLDGAADRGLRDRFDQFVLESEDIIPRAADALGRGDLAVFGDLVAASHLAAETLLRNQIPATSRLVRLARGLGAVAASAFGAGFGGSVWAMMDESNADAFVAEWRDRYAREFPDLALSAEFFVTSPGPGAYAL